MRLSGKSDASLRGWFAGLPGGCYTEPAIKPHFVMTKEPVVVQIGGTGPSAVKFVDPAHEPKKK